MPVYYPTLCVVGGDYWLQLPKPDPCLVGVIATLLFLYY